MLCLEGFLAKINIKESEPGLALELIHSTLAMVQEIFVSFDFKYESNWYFLHQLDQ